MKKTSVLFFFLSLFIITNYKQIKPEDTQNLFYELNYSELDIKTLQSTFSQEEMETIITKQIYRDNLFRYLKHDYFNLSDYENYEFYKTYYNLTHFEAVNYTNNKSLISLEPDDHRTIQPALFEETNLLLVNKQFYLNQTYEPGDLVLIENLSVVVPGDFNRNKISKEAHQQLTTLFRDALRNNIKLFVSSAYRPYDRQEEIYNSLILEGYENAMYSAKPGHSEHQTGLSVDVTSRDVSYRLIERFEETKEGQFILNNAHQYGFIIRYPKGKEHITGYYYEPWHLRYVGVDVANVIYNEQLTYEEYIFKYVPLPKQ